MEYGVKPILNIKVIVYNTSVLIYKYIIPIKDNII